MTRFVGIHGRVCSLETVRLMYNEVIAILLNAKSEF